MDKLCENCGASLTGEPIYGTRKIKDGRDWNYFCDDTCKAEYVVGKPLRIRITELKRERDEAVKVIGEIEEIAQHIPQPHKRAHAIIMLCLPFLSKEATHETNK